VARTSKLRFRGRPLLIGWIAVASLGALWLILERAGAGRERGHGRIMQDSRGSPPGLEPEPPDDSTDGPGLRNALDVARETAPARSGEAEPFDPNALVGSVRCGGAPVADVELFLFEGTRPGLERVQPVARAHGDASGGFRFAALERHVPYTLLAQGPGHLPAERVVFAGTHEVLELARAANVAGTVRARSDGRPLPGVEITLRRSSLGPAGLDARVSSTSDADGRWRLPWAEPGIQTFEVLQSGHLPERHQFQVPPEGAEGYTIELDDVCAELVLELTLLESGALLADTEVLSDDVPVHTDAQGHLALPLASEPDGTLLSLELVGGCRTRGRVRPPVASAGVLRVPLARGGTVRGRVLDAEDRPVAGAELRLVGGNRAPLVAGMPDGLGLESGLGATRSDADGRFELPGLAPCEGSVAVRASHARHPPSLSEPFALARLGASAEVEIRMQRGGTVAGSVLLDGEPAALSVVWSCEGERGWTRADERGAYAITGIPAGTLHLGARLDGGEQDGADGPERPGDLRLVVEDGASLTADLELSTQDMHVRGHVRDENGAPVAGAEVWALLPKGVQGRENHTTSAADGRFELAVPHAAGLPLALVAEQGPRQARVDGIRLGASGVELVLPALVSLPVRVLDASTGAPVQGFELYWREAGSGSFRQLVQGRASVAGGPDGVFMALLPAQHLDLVACARRLGYGPARRDGIDPRRASPEPVELELARGVDLELELHVAPDVADGLPAVRRARTVVATVEQWAERAHGGSWFDTEIRGQQVLRPDASGVARLEAMPVGRYRFFDAPGGLAFEPAEFEIPPGARHRLIVSLVPERAGTGGR